MDLEVKGKEGDEGIEVVSEEGAVGETIPILRRRVMAEKAAAEGSKSPAPPTGEDQMWESPPGEGQIKRGQIGDAGLMPAFLTVDEERLADTEVGQAVDTGLQGGIIRWMTPLENAVVKVAVEVVALMEVAREESPKETKTLRTNRPKRRHQHRPLPTTVSMEQWATITTPAR